MNNKSSFAIAAIFACCPFLFSCGSEVANESQAQFQEISVIEEIASSKIELGEAYLMKINDRERKEFLVQRWMSLYFCYWHQTTHRNFPKSEKLESSISGFIYDYVVNPQGQDPILVKIVTESFKKPFWPAEEMLKHGSDQYEPLLIWGYEVPWDDYPILVDEFRSHFINFFDQF